MQGGSCTICSRGRCSGKARRTGFACGSFGTGRISRGFCARLASRSSIESCICVSSRSSCSEERPYLWRSSRRSQSAASQAGVFERGRALGGSSLALRSASAASRGGECLLRLRCRSADLPLQACAIIANSAVRRERIVLENKGFLYRELRSCCANRTPPIDPFKQHRQLRSTQHHRAGRACGHTKGRAPGARKQTQPIATPPQNLTRSPARPRNTNRCPLKGSSASWVCTRAARPSNPLRMSVEPAASHTCAFGGSAITDAPADRSPAQAPSYPPGPEALCCGRSQA